MSTDTTVTDIFPDAFAPADLIGPTGIAENATEAIATVLTTYPRKLSDAQLLTENAEQTEAVGEDDIAALAKELGADRGQLRLKVRGGKDGQPLTVTYVFLDDRGAWKGCLPLSQLGGKLKPDPAPDVAGELKGHVSQKDAIASSRLAQDQEKLRERQSELELKAMGARLASLEAALGTSSGSSEPVRETPPQGLEDYFDTAREDVISGLKVTDRRTAIEILGLETRNEGRKTIINAANARLKELDDVEAAQAQRLEEQEAELERLRAQLQGSGEGETADPPQNA